MKDGKSGQALLVMILFLLVIAMIIIASQVMLTRLDMQQTTVYGGMTKAFHAADAGIDAALWKLRESNQIWIDALSGKPVAGHTGTPIHLSDDGTYYRVWFSTSLALQNKVKIICSGRYRNSIRTIEAVIQKVGIRGALEVGGEMKYKEGLHVEWGPIYAYKEFDRNPKDRWPRKFSVGEIKGRDENPGPPNTDSLEWWSYQDLGPDAQIDLTLYKQKAMATRIPKPHHGRCHLPDHDNHALCSGYFPDDRVHFRRAGFGEREDEGSLSHYIFKDTGAVIFVSGRDDGGMARVKFHKGTFLDINALIILGEEVKLHQHSTTYVTVIPMGAGQEYRHPDAEDSWRRFIPPNNPSGGEGGTFSVSNCAFHGFLYLNEWSSWIKGNHGNIVGVVKAKRHFEGRQMSIYLDTAVLAGIQLKESQLQRVLWDEVRPYWP